MEKRECKAIIILCFVSLLFAATPLIAAEIYMWVDEKGVSHITDQPPSRPVKMLGKDSYQRDSPEEIRRYEKERELARIQNEQETERQREYNRAKESAENMKFRISTKIKEYEKERNEKLDRDIRDLEKEKEEALRKKNNANFDWSKEFWENQEQRADRSIQDKKKIIEKSGK